MTLAQHPGKGGDKDWVQAHSCFTRSCLQNEAPLKNIDACVSLLVDEHIHVPEE